MSFRSRLAGFLYGRYGTDQLYNALLLSQIVCLFLGAALGIPGNFYTAFAIASAVMYGLGITLFVWTVFRCLSRNISARRRENQAYLRLKARLKRSDKKASPVCPADTATHIFRLCPRCKATLRLPRSPGKHTVKCPRCTRKFKIKVK